MQTVVQMEQIRELPLSIAQSGGARQPGARACGSRARAGPSAGRRCRASACASNQTEFQLDGLNANAAMDEGGITIPNVDTIAEFSVETSSFSAENGRNPLQVVMATKSGTNAFHGTAWEFNQNDRFSARNAFSSGRSAEAASQPVRRRGRRSGRAQQDVLLRQLRGHAHRGARISTTRLCPGGDARRATSPALSRAILDPLTGQPFPGNIIPANRISNASKFFFPYVLHAELAGRTLPRGRAGDRRHVPVHGARRSSDHQRSAHLRPLGDEQEHERLAGLLAGRALGERDHAAQHRRELHQHADARRCC